MSDLSPLRKGRITGSRVSTVLGLNKYQTRADLLREMAREALGAPAEFTGNVATEFGQEHEGDAITEYERTKGVLVHSCQRFFIHPTYDFLAVTVDGLVDADGLVEAKAPFRANYAHIDERPDYAAQIRLQLECSGRVWGDFIRWRDGDVAVSRVEHDPAWLPSVLPTLTDFLEELLAVLADPAAVALFVAPKKRRGRAA